MASVKKQSQEQTYQSIRGYIVDAQRQVRAAVNSAMGRCVLADWGGYFQGVRGQ